MLFAVAPGTAAALGLGLAGSTADVGDVQVADQAGAALLSGDFAVYAHFPEAQMGPLALVLAGGLPRSMFIVAVCALLAGFLTIALRLGVPDRMAMIGGLLVAAPWAHLAITGHADDPIVLLGAAAVLVGLRERSTVWLVVGFVAAMAGKPTAILLLGLLLLAGWRLTVRGVAVTAAVWTPFVLADLHGFVSAGQGVALVQSWSGPFLLGADAGDAFPIWVRPVQLIGCVGLAFVVGRWRGAASGLVVAFAFRIALEPGAWPSYCATLVAVALLVQSGWRLPMICASAGAWLVSWRFPLDALEGLTRLILLVLVGALAAAGEDALRHRASRDPMPGPGEQSRSAAGPS